MHFLLPGWAEGTGWCSRNRGHQPSGGRCLRSALVTVLPVPAAQRRALGCHAGSLRRSWDTSVQNRPCFPCSTVLLLSPFRSLTSLVSHCMSPLSGTQGGPRSPKPFSTNKKQDKQDPRGFCTQEGPRGSCLVSGPAFPRCSLTPRDTGIKGGTALTSAAEELGFGGPGFVEACRSAGNLDSEK